MQIWKTPCLFEFIQKQYPENFAFLIQEFSSYLTVNFVTFLKSFLKFLKSFNVFYFIWMFVNKLFTYLTCACLQK